MAEEPDVINKPSHYQIPGLGCEVLDVILALRLDFLLGNVAKYVLRAGKKEGESEVQDLIKAMDYLGKKIAELKEREIEKMFKDHTFEQVGGGYTAQSTLAEHLKENLQAMYSKKEEEKGDEKKEEKWWAGFRVITLGPSREICLTSEELSNLFKYYHGLNKMEEQEEPHVRATDP